MNLPKSKRRARHLVLRCVVAAALLATTSIATISSFRHADAASSCTDRVSFTAATTIDSNTLSADKATRTATGSMVVTKPTGTVTLDYELSLTYYDKNGERAYNRFAFTANNPTAALPYSGGLTTAATPLESGYTLEVNMSYEAVEPAGADVGLMFYGRNFARDNGRSAFLGYAITAMNSSSPAYLFDPAGQLTFDGNPIPTSGQALSAGDSFTQPRITNNGSLEWYAVLPQDATEFAFTASRGNAWEGFTFTTGDANLCLPVVPDSQPAVVVSPEAPAVVDVFAGTLTDANHDSSDPKTFGPAVTDPDGDISVATVAILDPSSGEPVTGPLTVAGEGSYEVVDNQIVFTPEPGFVGQATAIEYEVTDEQLLTKTGTIQLDVAAAPMAADDEAVTNVDVPVLLYPADNDSADSGIDPTTIEFVDPATDTPTTGPVTIDGVGTFALDTATGEVTFTPADGYAGPAAIDYYVADNAGTRVSSPATISIDVQGPPVAVTDNDVTNVDTPVTINPLANDMDPNGDESIAAGSVTFVDPATGTPAAGPVTIAGVGTFSVDGTTGEVTFEPATGYIGSATIDYTVTDQYGNQSNAAGINIDVVAPPIAEPDTDSTLSSDPVTVSPAANDSDPDGTVDPASIRLIDPATGEAATGPVVIDGEGTYTVDDATGEVTFTPDPAFAGESSVEYVIDDNDGNPSNVATITIEVAGVPDTQPDTGTTRNDTPVTIDPLANDSDADGTVDPTTVTLIDPATGTAATGPVTIAGEGTYTVDPATGEVTFTPDPAYAGTSTITYTVADDDGNVSAPAVISIEVWEPPSGQPDTDRSLDGLPVTLSPASNDSDPDGTIDPTTVQLINPDSGQPTDGPVAVPDEGTYTLDPATGDVTFTPVDGFTGQSTIQYVVADNEGNLTAATDITIDVQASPVSTDGQAVTLGEPVLFYPAATATDADGSVDVTGVVLLDSVSGDKIDSTLTVEGQGTFVLDPATGGITFTPVDGFVGDVEVDFYVIDDDGNTSAPSTFTVSSQARPVAEDDEATSLGDPVTVNPLANDSDDGAVDPTTVQLVDPATDQPTNEVVIDGVGVYTVDPDTGEVTFTPEEGYAGVSSIEYVVEDNDGNPSLPATITVDTQLPPVANDDTVTVVAEPVTIDPLDNDTDDRTIDPTTVTLINPATGEAVTDTLTIDGQGELTVDPVTGEITFEPAEGFSGVVLVEYTVADDQGHVSERANIEFDCHLPPEASDDAATAVSGPVTIHPADNDTDPDSAIEPASVTLIDPASGETTSDPVTIDGEGTYEVDPATGEVTFTPADGFAGLSTVDYVVEDDFGFRSAPATITIDSQLRPVAEDDSAVAVGEPVIIDPLGNDSDADSAVESARVTLLDPATGDPVDGPVSIDGAGSFSVDPDTGEVTFEPVDGFTGPVSVDYVVTDDDGNVSAPAAISVDVQAGPVVTDDEAVALDGPVTILPAVNDSDADGEVDPTSLVLIDPDTGVAASGPVTIDGEGTYAVDPSTGSVTFTPVDDYTGLSSITYTVADDDGNVSAPATITVDVQVPPTVLDDEASTVGQPVTVDPTTNDADPDGTVAPATVQLIDPASGEASDGPVTIDGEGTFVLDSDTGRVTFTPVDGFLGTSSVDYVVADDDGNRSPAATITIDSQAAPVAEADTATAVGEPVTVNPFDNDSDVDGTVAPESVKLIDPSTGVATDGPVTIDGEGTYTINPANGVVMFEPASGFVGLSSIEYIVADDDGNPSAPATITIDSQLPPTVASDTAVTVGEPVTVNPVSNDSDVDGSIDPSTLALIDPVTDEPTAGPVTVDGEGVFTLNPATSEVTFTPEDGFAGTATIEYTVADDEGNASNPGSINIDVKAAPVAEADDVASLAGVESIVIQPTANDTDADGTIDPGSVQLIDPHTGDRTSDPVVMPGEATYSVNPDSGEIICVPDADFVGSSSIHYVVSDNEGHFSQPALISVAIYLAPVAEPDAAVANGGPVTLDLLGNDSDDDGTVDRSTIVLIDPATGEVTTDPVTIEGEGTFALDGTTGQVTFTPVAGFAGESRIEYRVSDNHGNLSNIASITIEVNAAPVLSPDTASSDGSPVTLDLSSNDDGVSGATFALIDPATGEPTTSTLTVANVGSWSIDPATGQATFTPVACFSGDAVIDYVATSSANLASAPATVTVDVTSSCPPDKLALKGQNEPSRLAFTGSSTFTLVLAGLALTLAGGVVVIRQRRHRVSES